MAEIASAIEELPDGLPSPIRCLYEAVREYGGLRREAPTESEGTVDTPAGAQVTSEYDEEQIDESPRKLNDWTKVGFEEILELIAELTDQWKTMAYPTSRSTIHGILQRDGCIVDRGLYGDRGSWSRHSS
jgi:hypothetical protein